MDENPPTVYIKVYEGVQDWLHELIVQGLQVVVPQLQPLQRVQVVKGIVLNGCDADGIFFRILRQTIIRLGTISLHLASITHFSSFSINYSLVVLKPEILYVLPVTLKAM